MHHRFFQGETLLLTFTDDDAPLTGYTITAGVKKGCFYAPLTFTPVDMENGVYQFSATAEETANWPTGRLECGLKYVFGQTAYAPEPFDIHIMESVVK